MQGESKPHVELQESKVSYSSTSGCCFELPSSISEAIARIGIAAVLVVGGAGCSTLYIERARCLISLSTRPRVTAVPSMAGESLLLPSFVPPSCRVKYFAITFCAATD